MGRRVDHKRLIRRLELAQSHDTKAICSYARKHAKGAFTYASLCDRNCSFGHSQRLVSTTASPNFGHACTISVAATIPVWGMRLWMFCETESRAPEVYTTCDRTRIVVTL